MTEPEPKPPIVMGDRQRIDTPPMLLEQDSSAAREVREDQSEEFDPFVWFFQTIWAGLVLLTLFVIVAFVARTVTERLWAEKLETDPPVVDESVNRRTDDLKPQKLDVQEMKSVREMLRQVKENPLPERLNEPSFPTPDRREETTPENP